MKTLYTFYIVYNGHSQVLLKAFLPEHWLS